jgi:hypothetical protein
MGSAVKSAAGAADSAVIPLPLILVPSQLPEMLGGHPRAVKVMIYVPLPCPLMAVPLKLRVKGEVLYGGETEGFVAVPVAVSEILDPAIVTGASE